ncbi:MAG: hypothetical protein FWF56_03655 [Firmicutes bacterium]|nr:hypothetical protein [Bacillota bacterium]
MERKLEPQSWLTGAFLLSKLGVGCFVLEGIDRQECLTKRKNKIFASQM